MEPTPLPWHLEEIYENNYVICDEHNNVVCELRGSFQYKSDKIIGEQQRIDGEVIIEAVRNYYECIGGD